MTIRRFSAEDLRRANELHNQAQRGRFVSDATSRMKTVRRELERDRRAARAETERAAERAVASKQAALRPTKETQRVVAAMTRLASKAKAGQFIHALVQSFVERMGRLVVVRMRQNVREPVGGRSVGHAKLNPLSVLLRQTATTEQSSPLFDTGKLEKILSYRWRSKPKLQIEVGPLGPTPLAKRAGFDTIAATTHPMSLSGKEKADVTYADLAWFHELGYVVKPTQRMVNFFQWLSMNEPYGVAGVAEAATEDVRAQSPAYRMLRAIGVQLPDGGWMPAPGVVLTTPARPFMAPALQESSVFVRAQFPELSRRVFTGWVGVGPWGKPAMIRQWTPDEKTGARAVELVKAYKPPTSFTTFGRGLAASAAKE